MLTTSSFFKSPMVTLLVGPAKNKFQVHAPILEEVLVHLASSIGETKEHIEIQEDIADVLGPVCEFLYTGDYSIASSIIEEGEDCRNNGLFSSLKNSSSQIRARSGTASIHNEDSVGRERTVFLFDHFPARSSSSNSETEKQTTTLSLHLRIHVFAEKYGMTLLSLISFKRFLFAFTEEPKARGHIDGIMDLFRLAKDQI